ncbi:MAG: hypothetical protein LBJ97_02695 [Mycoplasmataceae bacterium]|nr:hypothetical protein [Mycoplasmataceae bacterium]
MKKDKEKSVSIFKAYLIEIKDRWFSSSKRIMSTVGVLFIPFIYAFTCIAAYWNPLPKIGLAPISIASLDKEQLVVRDTDAPDPNKKVVLGIPLEYTTDSFYSDGADWHEISSSYLTSVDKWNGLTSDDGKPITYIQTQAGSICDYSHTINSSGAGDANMISVVDQVMAKWQSGTMVKEGFDYDSKKNSFHLNFSKTFPIENIKYHNIGNSNSLSNWATDANKLATHDNGKWDIKNKNDYVQISLPQTLTENLVGYLDASISNKVDPETYLDNIHNDPVDLYLTYEKTFLAPRIINEVEDMLPTLLNGSLPVAISSLAEGLLDDVTSKVSLPWDQGGYSWTPTQEIVLPTGISWHDHGYEQELTPETKTGGDVPEAISGRLILEPGKLYTIPNEEFRAQLINQITTDYPTDAAKLAALDSNNKYHLIPTIEGITGTAANYNWNPTSDADTDPEHSLLYQIKNITSTLVEIPLIRNTIADVTNLIVNTNLDKLVDDDTSVPYVFSIDIGPNDIKTLLSSDQFLSGLLMQDSRYIIPDDRAPSIPVVANESLPIPIGADLNFGRIIALMCNTGDTLGAVKFANIFQTFDLRSAYTSNNTNYNDTDVSYHKGDILYDLGLPSLISQYDYAINTPILESSGSSDFNFVTNLTHNYQIILGVAVQQFEKLAPDYYVDYTTIGGEYQEYGIGLGAFFICIGMCVGTLTQIMIYDKKKRVRRIRAPSWYRSKTLMMVSTTLIQGSILAFSIGCLGWFSIGSAFVYEWLFILFSGLIFISIIQALWFSFRYRALGFFCVVIFMVLNLAAGWGTFPPYAQFEIFNVISNILPFTYMMHAQDAIIYGISTGAHVFENSMVVLENVGILLIYLVLFNALGTFMSYRRERELLYGTYNRKHLGVVLKKLGYSKYCKTSKKGVTLVDWKKIPHEEMPKVKGLAQTLFPYEKIRQKYKSPEMIRDIVDFDNN